MKMYNEINKRQAFELVAQALLEIDRYKKAKDRFGYLKSAKKYLDDALKLESKSIRILYYSAVLDDLLHDSCGAIKKLCKIISEKPSFIYEVHYNLAVAYYHRYHLEWLNRAIENFSCVCENTPINSGLNLLSHSGMAQAFAMKMIPSNPNEFNLDTIRSNFNLAMDEIKKVDVGLDNLQEKEKTLIDEIVWARNNARGMAMMYYSDYFGDSEEKRNMLLEVVTILKEADVYSPKNWANYCDLGSAYMRLGYWSKDRGYFNETIKYLSEVLNLLLPNYGFAFYEMGRAYRIMGNFEEAKRFYKKALEIPEEKRDVGANRINMEVDRNERRLTEYP
jgi:tetratricopeptide (TPR) repeat protein